MRRHTNKRAIILASIAAMVLIFVGYTRVVIPMANDERPEEKTYYNPDGSVDRHTAHIMNYHLRERHKNLYEAVQKRTWAENQNSQEVGPVIESLMFIADYDEDRAVDLTGMPFLDTLEEPDVHAAETLVGLFYWENEAFQEVMSHRTVSDGITDEEAKLISLLAGLHENNPALVREILNVSRTNVTEKKISLPLGGDVTLAIVRTEGGKTISMDLLEKAVRETESLMGIPFPSQYITLLFEKTVPEDAEGVHVGNFIAILPSYEKLEAERRSVLAHLIIHEVAHYYWRNGQAWLNEGAADFTATYVERKGSKKALEPSNEPCDADITLRDLEKLEWAGSEAHFACNYALGERLFIDLYNTLGEKAFRRGMQQLYHSSEKVYEQSAGMAGIWELRQAFKKEAELSSDVDATTVDQLVDRWYLGKEAAPTSFPIPSK